MPKYAFALNAIQIDQIRSQFQDTATASVGLRVGDTIYPSQTASLGDVGTGTYYPNLLYDDIELDDSSTPVSFTYAGINSGHEQNQTASDIADFSFWLAKQSFDLGLDPRFDAMWPEVATGAIALGVAAAVVGAVAALFSADCDGWLFAGGYAVTADTLGLWTGATNVYEETRAYPGQDSSPLCGRNSLYRVQHHVRCEQPLGPSVELAVAPDPLPVRRPISLTVYARDSATQAPLAGVVTLSGASFPTNAPHPITIVPRVIHHGRPNGAGDGNGGVDVIYPTGQVIVPGYPVKAIDLGDWVGGA